MILVTKTSDQTLTYDVGSSHIIAEYMDQPGKVASPARGQLNRKTEYCPIRVRA